jgi:hypothetical protein
MEVMTVVGTAVVVELHGVVVGAGIEVEIVERGQNVVVLVRVSVIVEPPVV